MRPQELIEGLRPVNCRIRHLGSLGSCVFKPDGSKERPTPCLAIQTLVMQTLCRTRPRLRSGLYQLDGTGASLLRVCCYQGTVSDIKWAGTWTYASMWSSLDLELSYMIVGYCRFLWFNTINPNVEWWNSTNDNHGLWTHQPTGNFDDGFCTKKAWWYPQIILFLVDFPL